MKPKTVKDLKEALEQYPDDLFLCTAADEEGNSFGLVYYDPSKGTLVGNDFISDSEEKDAEFKSKPKGKKVLCIN
jgi:hypothetical protein